jgi:pimeloyl-ACP methyl ester carboxylesterase
MPDDRTASGTSFHYELDDFTDPWTTNDTVLLQHGFGRSGRFWYGWVPPLSSHYRVIRRDMRGHGGSEDPGPDHIWSADELANDLKEFLDAVELDSIHYVGESVSAMVGVLFASRWPERLKSLTLCSMAMAMPKADYAAGKFFVPGTDMDWRTALTELGVGGWAEAQMFEGGLAGQEGSPERHRWLVDEWDKTPRHVALGLQSAAMDLDVAPLFSGITVPTLVLAPARSALQPLARQVKIYEGIPGSKIAVIDAPSHEVYLDRTAEATAAYLSFLRDLPGS